MIAVLSVEHTGTHFTAWVVEQLTGKNTEWAAPVNPEAFDTPDIGCLIQHVYPNGYNSHADALVEVLLDARYVVVPMRHPMKALVSGIERGSKLTPIEHATAFHRLASWYHTKRVHFFHVDCAATEQAQQIHDLANYLSVPAQCVPWHKMNRTPQRQHTEHRKALARRDWDALEVPAALTLERSFFDRFGYDLPCSN